MRIQALKKYLSLVLLAGLLLLAGGCSGKVDSQTIAAYQGEVISVYGLSDEPVQVKVADLAALPMEKRNATANRANGEKVSIAGVGPLLDTFLQQYGVKQSDFNRVRFTANDGYSVAVSAEVLENREIMLALSDGGQPLSKDDQPVRVVIPGERAMYWVRHLQRIDLERNDVQTNTTKVIFLETAVPQLESHPYEYYGQTDQTVACRDLLETFVGIKNDGTVIRLQAADGLRKTETEQNFLSGQLKYSGDDSPKFVSDQLPVGMHTHSLVWIGYGDASFASLTRLIELYGEDGSLYFSDFLRLSELPSSESYSIVYGQDGQQTVTAQALAKASLALDSDGTARLNGLANSEPLQQVLSIEAVR